MAQHISDLDIALYAFDPELVAPELGAEIARHTAGCAECGARLDFYSVTEEDLRDPDVWRPVAPSARASIRAYANRCVAEDAEAEELLEPHLANPAKAIWEVPKRREFHTGGVVRRLNARAHDLAENEPMTALACADIAQSIAELLPDDMYPHNAVYELRGTAWKERANALLQLGRFDDALESLLWAEQTYKELRFSSPGLAAVELVRASVYYQLRQLETAESHARRAEYAYAYLAQERGRIKALFLRGSIKYEAHDLTLAASLFQQVIAFGENAPDRKWIGKGSYARANCELDQGNVARASSLFHTALVVFRDTGAAIDRICTEWGLARVLLHSDRPDEAARGLRDVIRQLEELPMVMDAAIATLDLADALIVLNQPKQVAKLAAHAFVVLRQAGVVTAALTALAYVREAASTDRLNRQIIRDVRTFLRRVERSPELLFVPPPESFS